MDDGPALGDLLTMGMTLALYLVIGFGLGWVLDLSLGTFPGFALAGFALGVAAACTYFYKQCKRYLRASSPSSTATPWTGASEEGS